MDRSHPGKSNLERRNAVKRHMDPGNAGQHDMDMTREQMIDAAVRKSMARVTMKQVVRGADDMIRIRATCVPVAYGAPGWGQENAANPDWWEGTPAENGLRWFPGRVRAIRKEFARIASTPKAQING